MAKDYLCKDCKYNNNGWCTERKMNGLKIVTECVLKPDKEPKGEIKDYQFEYEQVGKREMYHNIQSQIIGIDGDEALNDKQKYEFLITVINNLGDMLKISESIGDTMKVLNSSGILTDIREDSIKIQEYLINKYGRYV